MTRNECENPRQHLRRRAGRPGTAISLGSPAELWTETWGRGAQRGRHCGSVTCPRSLRGAGGLHDGVGQAALVSSAPPRFSGEDSAAQQRILPGQRPQGEGIWADPASILISRAQVSGLALATASGATLPTLGTRVATPFVRLRPVGCLVLQTNHECRVHVPRAPHPPTPHSRLQQLSSFGAKSC